MNDRPCRVHMWLADDRCGLCGAVNDHRHDYGEWQVSAWLRPGEADAPRKASR